MKKSIGWTIGLGALGAGSSYALASLKHQNKMAWLIGGFIVGAAVGYYADRAVDKIKYR